MVDRVVVGRTRRRRELCLYETPEPLARVMVNLLQLEAGDRVLDCGAGRGGLTDAVLAQAPRDVRIDAFEIEPSLVTDLRQRYRTDCRVRVTRADFLLENGLDHGTGYTKIIANPPFGAWQSAQRRQALKARFGGYVKETYAVFLQRALELLSPGGRLVFIIPDTFFSLHRHEALRAAIYASTSVDELLLFPSRLFEGVAFGYSGLAIVSLTNAAAAPTHSIALRRVKSLRQLDVGGPSPQFVRQASVRSDAKNGVMAVSSLEMQRATARATAQLGDVAECVTGFYSGDNRRFVSPMASEDTSSGVAPEEVEFALQDRAKLMDGLSNGKHYVPILRGRAERFRTPTRSVVRWDADAVAHYRTSRRARFQNARFYFCEGIGVPMVRSSSLKAFHLERRLFDQSVVGVFPNEERLRDYILAFLNSEVATSLINALNPTANNSANYLKRLPLILDEDLIRDVEAHVTVTLAELDPATALERINTTFGNAFGLRPGFGA